MTTSTYCQDNLEDGMTFLSRNSHVILRVVSFDNELGIGFVRVKKNKRIQMIRRHPYLNVWCYLSLDDYCTCIAKHKNI